MRCRNAILCRLSHHIASGCGDTKQSGMPTCDSFMVFFLRSSQVVVLEIPPQDQHFQSGSVANGTHL